MINSWSLVSRVYLLTALLQVPRTIKIEFKSHTSHYCLCDSTVSDAGWTGGAVRSGPSLYFETCQSTFQPVQRSFSSTQIKTGGQETSFKHQITSYSQIPQNRWSIKFYNTQDLLVSQPVPGNVTILTSMVGVFFPPQSHVSGATL